MSELTFSHHRLAIETRSPDRTAELAVRLGARLAPGDCVLLEGPIGAGKTHFARALIQSLLGVPEDVPSPTFTLVQTYDTAAGELWHADLYRLTSAGEIEELGLTQAFETAICLVEWPERLGALAPGDALTVRFATDPYRDEVRHIAFAWTDNRWRHLLGMIVDD